MKETPFGKIPENWEVKKIIEITDLVTDYVANGSFKSLADNVNYEDHEDSTVLIRLVDYNNDFQGNFVYVNDHAYEFLAKSKLFGNEIIISNVGANVGTVFRCPYLEKKMTLGPNSIMVKFKESDDFYYYWLKSPAGQHMIRSIVTGSAQPKFNKTNFRDMLAPVPPRKEQEEIAAILSSLDAKIEVNKKINKNLHAQAETLFQGWFIHNPAEETWPLTTLDNLTSLISRGITPKYDDKSDQLVLNQKCIRDHNIDISLARRHMPKTINNKWLQYGDLLINSTGQGTLGRAAQVWFVPQKMTVDSHIMIVRPKNQQLTYYIGFWGLLHEREIEALHTGSTGQTELPRELVKAIEIRMPDNETLTKFNSMVRPIASTIVSNQEENECLVNLRDILLPKLMSGEIDVSNIAF